MVPLTVLTRMRLRFSLLVPSLLACSAAIPGPTPAQQLDGPVEERITRVLERDRQRLIDFRRDLHRHPEVSFQEQRTAERIASELRRIGAEVRTGVGGHGVVGIVRGRTPGPLVAWRADMDAVPSTAPDPVDFRSVVSGVRHICGHDIHVTVGLAMAAALQEIRDSLSGSVMFVFQPAEERVAGAKAMLADGVFRTEQPVAIYGLHTAPFEVGQVATTPGPMMAGRDRFEIRFQGSGDVAAARQAAASHLRRLATVDPSQASVSQPPEFIMVAFDDATDPAMLSGFVTVAAAESRARMSRAVTTELQQAMPAGMTASATYTPKFIAGVTNDLTLTPAARNAAATALGAANVLPITSIPPGFSEDFGSFQDAVPGVFFYLGVSNQQRGWVGMPHSPGYVADEGSITVGARLGLAVLRDRLSTSGSSR